MKRFASFITAAALAGSLLGTETDAQANSTMSLVPVSPLSGTYIAGDIINFSAVLNLGTSSFAAFSVPTAAGYLNSQFDTPDPNAGPQSPGNGMAGYGIDKTATFSGVNASGGTSLYPLYSLFVPDVNSTTASKINGEPVQAVQAVANHPHTAITLSGGDKLTLAVPAGTYTLATFAFTVASTYQSGPLSVYLTTPNGFADTASDADGAFLRGIGSTYQINGKSPLGFAFGEPLSFPVNGQSLTFNVGAVPEPGSLALLLGMTAAGVSVLRKRRNR